jgi:hypothetical protein
MFHVCASLYLKRREKEENLDRIPVEGLMLSLVEKEENLDRIPVEGLMLSLVSNKR